jgi:hypothetical protein
MANKKTPGRNKKNPEDLKTESCRLAYTKNQWGKLQAKAIEIQGHNDVQMFLYNLSLKQIQD